MITFLASHLWWLLALAVLTLAILSLPTLLRFRWQVAVAVFAIAACVQWLHAGQLQQQITDQRAVAAEAALAYTETVRIAEQAHAKNLADLSALAAQEQANANREIEALRDRVRAGDLQLRKRFTCPQAAAGAAGGAVAGSVVGQQTAGLTTEDAQFLVRIAAEGDDAIRERNLCIAVAAEYRSLLQSLEAQR